MPAQLVALNDSPSILVDKPILLLGRHPECDIQIDSRKISRRHCCIAQVNEYLVVRDLDSTNGIRINGVRVHEGKLGPGDELMIANFRYRITWQDPSPRPTASAQTEKPRSLSPPNLPRPDEDDLLESSDEPIALPEPRAQAVPGPAHHATPPPPPAKADSRILPDELNLLPRSGSLSDLSGPSRGPQRK